MQPNELTAGQALAAMAAGNLTSRALVESCLARIAEREDTVRAWAFLDAGLALAQADAADARRAAGDAGPLNGLPVGIKDIIDTADQPTENGSKVCAGRQPDKDATLVRLLREAGAVILGKTVTTEFALSAPGKTRNPHDPAHTPGGSSSGSAAAVADFMVPLAIGTQTGGSVLRPSSYNGIYGLKPTFGTISRAGLSPLSRRLDHPGIHARAPEDLALVAAVLMKTDKADPDMRGHAAFRDHVPLPAAPAPRLAFVRGPAWTFADADMQRAMEGLADKLGDAVTARDLPPEFDDALSSQAAIMNGAVAASLGPYYDTARDRMDPKTVKRVEAGLPVSARDYLTALDKAEKMQAALAGFFADVDAVLTPAAPGQAPRDLGTTGNAVFNGYWTMMGVPAVSAPLLKGDSGLPMGVQVVCPWGEDGRAVAVARWLANQIGEWK